MAEFTPIETQEQFDAMVKDRIARAERATAEKISEKYSDYDTLKTQNNDLSNQIAQLTEQIRKQTETIDGNKTVVDDLTAKVQAYETASVKTKIALELGLPYQMAERLNGTDEESIRKDAEAVMTLIGSKKPVAPLGSGEPVASNSDPLTAAKAEFARWLESQN